MSIIISTGDQMVVVLRNGVEIGRPRAVVSQQALESQVLTLTKDGRGRSEWIQVGVNNLDARGFAAIVSTQGVERMQLPAPFVERMRAGDDAGDDGADHQRQRRCQDDRRADHGDRFGRGWDQLASALGAYVGLPKDSATLALRYVSPMLGSPPDCLCVGWWS